MPSQAKAAAVNGLNLAPRPARPPSRQMWYTFHGRKAGWEVIQVLQPADREVAMRFKARLMELGVPIIEMLVFGSRARGDSSPDSDLDVCLLLGEVNPLIRDAIDRAAWECGFEADRVITTVEYTPEEIYRSPLRHSPFVQTILREGVPV